MSLINADDVYLMNNLSYRGTKAGLGEAAIPCWEMLQQERPQHALSFLLHASHLDTEGDLKGAIAKIEADGKIFSAEESRDQALAFHILLLKKDGQINRVKSLTKIYLSEDLIKDRKSKKSLETIMRKIDLQEKKIRS